MKPRPQALQKSLMQSLAPVVQSMTDTHAAAQCVYAENRKRDMRTAIDDLNASLEAYESATRRIKPHCQPKAKTAAKGKAKAKASKS